MAGFFDHMELWMKVVLVLLVIFTVCVIVYFIYLVHLGNIAIREQEKVKIYMLEKSALRSVDSPSSGGAGAPQSAQSYSHPPSSPPLLRPHTDAFSSLSNDYRGKHATTSTSPKVFPVSNDGSSKQVGVTTTDRHVYVYCSLMGRLLTNYV